MKFMWFFLKRSKVLRPYLDGSEGIYALWTLSFSNKIRTRMSCVFNDINKRQISFTYY